MRRMFQPEKLKKMWEDAIPKPDQHSCAVIYFGTPGHMDESEHEKRYIAMCNPYKDEPDDITRIVNKS